jgi:hypothetical protein
MPISMLIILLQIGSFSLWAWHKDELEDTYLIYEHATGKALLFLRVLIFIVFGLGCLRLASLSVGKRKHFVKSFAKLGSAYLLGWPVAVIVCEILLPKYMISRVIMLFEEGVHVVVNAQICWLFAFPDSNYKKNTIKTDEDLMATGELPK